MTQLHDDIHRLFQSFDGDPGQFKEFARSNYAREAEQRWPLLHDVAPMLGTPAEALSDERKALWKRIAAVPAAADKAVASSHASELAQQLATLSPAAAQPAATHAAAHALGRDAAPASPTPTPTPTPSKVVAPTPARKTVAPRAGLRSVLPASPVANAPAPAPSTPQVAAAEPALSAAALAHLGRQVIFDPVLSGPGRTPPLRAAAPSPVAPAVPAAPAAKPAASATPQGAGLFARQRADAMPLHHAAPAADVRPDVRPLHAPAIQTIRASQAMAPPPQRGLFGAAAGATATPQAAHPASNALGSLLRRISDPATAKSTAANGLFAHAPTPAPAPVPMFAGRFGR